MPPKTKKNLTAKQLMFCKEFLIDFNGTQAAIRAGYSKKTARQIATENLAKPYVRNEIEKLMDERTKRVERSADEVIEKLWEVADRCTQTVPVFDKSGKEAGEFKFDSSGANRSLELLGKHFKLFTEKIESLSRIDIRYEEAESQADAAIEALSK